MRITDKFESVAGVYVMKCLASGKYYIGESINIKQRMYKHRNKSIKTVIGKAFSKYGINDFEIYVEYLPDFDKDSLLILEEQLIKKFSSISPKGYNISSKGKGMHGMKHSEESKLKMSNIKLGIKPSEETKIKMSIAGRNRASSQKGKPRKPRGPISEETRIKLSKAKLGKTGKKHSEESKLKISNSLKGHIISEETKLKISISKKLCNTLGEELPQEC